MRFESFAAIRWYHCLRRGGFIHRDTPIWRVIPEAVKAARELRQADWLDEL